MAEAPGQMLLHYRLIKKIGEGGMGEVYLAEDTKLDRRVALKLLPKEMAGDPQRYKRFEREAKAVAALNHPNIVTIHSVEEVEGLHFITMEYVKGRTLTELIPKKGMALNRLFGLVLPLAEAMSNAHRQGITHRDLKPDNLIVGEDARLKILDFGLAKLKEETAVQSGNSRLETMTATTEAGMILGTVSYMSPEQAEGKPADPRSDVFSLGIILYELATGQRPFRGDTKISILSSIVRDVPTPPTELNPALPRHLARIIKRCLSKDPLRRYQTALELRNELEELKEELDSGELAATDGGATPERRQTWRWGVAPVVAAIAIFALVVGYRVLRPSEGPREALSPPIAASFTPLTSQPGVESYPSLSPDGTWFVYQSAAAGNLDIYLQAVGGQKPINLTQDSKDDDRQPVFSRDGRQIAFRSERAGGGIFVMGRTGESVRRISDVGFNPAWSPDGTEVVYSTDGFRTPQVRFVTNAELRVVSPLTGESRRIAEDDAVQPAWSPHGHRVAYWAVHQETGQRDIRTVPATGGEVVPVTDDPDLDWSPAWSPDGDFLYFSSDRGGSRNLWRVPIEEESGRTLGPPEPLTTPASSAGPLVVSSDGRRIAYTAWSVTSNLRKADFDPSTATIASEPSWITRGTRQVSYADLSPDGGSIAFMLLGAREDIYVVRTDGSGETQLTDDLYRDRLPRWSPDGKRIVFFSDRSGSWEAWLANRDGSGLTQFSDTPGGQVLYCEWAPDGQHMVCAIDKAGFIVDVHKPWAEQSPEPLPEYREDGKIAVLDAWSPDGRWLAGTMRGPDWSYPYGIFVYSVERREYRKLTDRGAFPVWLSDSRRLLYSAEGEVFLLDTQSGESRRVSPTPENFDYAVGVSPDEDVVYFIEGTTEADIWLLEMD